MLATFSATVMIQTGLPGLDHSAVNPWFDEGSKKPCLSFLFGTSDRNTFLSDGANVNESARFLLHHLENRSFFIRSPDWVKFLVLVDPALSFL